MSSLNPATAAISIAAPAKLNLYLHVVGRRPDGYHLLDSLVAFTGLHDTVSVMPADGLTLSVEGPFESNLKKPADNLVLRAARLLADTAGCRPGAEIRLIKRLPVAAGIGGGSSDAAAVLRGLCRLWEIEMPGPDLQALALRLGADVPVCLAGRAAYVGGIGEDIDPAPALAPAGVVLANPRRMLPTARVFSKRQGPYSEPARLDQTDFDIGNSAAGLAAALARRNNDLTEAASTLAPVVGDVLGTLARSLGCLLARMSGSGATCFGLYRSLAEAQTAAAGLSAERTDWWVRATPLVSDAASITVDRKGL